MRYWRNWASQPWGRDKPKLVVNILEWIEQEIGETLFEKRYNIKSGGHKWKNICLLNFIQ
jgi:hypothetical protein